MTRIQQRPGLRSFWACAILLFCSWAHAATADEVVLAWDPSSSPNIAGYRLYARTRIGGYAQIFELGNISRALVSNLVGGLTYYFAVSAYDREGVESELSNEISYAVPILKPPPTSKPTPNPTPLSAKNQP